MLLFAQSKSRACLLSEIACARPSCPGPAGVVVVVVVGGGADAERGPGSHSVHCRSPCSQPGAPASRLETAARSGVPDSLIGSLHHDPLTRPSGQPPRALSYSWEGLPWAQGQEEQLPFLGSKTLTRGVGRVGGGRCAADVDTLGAWLRDGFGLWSKHGPGARDPGVHVLTLPVINWGTRAGGSPSLSQWAGDKEEPASQGG